MAGDTESSIRLAHWYYLKRIDVDVLREIVCLYITSFLFIGGVLGLIGKLVGVNL